MGERAGVENVMITAPQRSLARPPPAVAEDDGHLAGRRLWPLRLAVALEGQPGVWAIAGDTDGIGGADAAAGAILTPETLARAAAMGIEPRARLADNDGHGFFQALGDQLVTGPTLTNVNDFRAILILPTVA